MQAIIMAAGKGMRLRPFTNDKPKPLLEINGRPLLAYTLLALPETITEVVIVIGYLGELIQKHFGEHFGQLNLSYIQQGEIPGTAGALWSVKQAIKSEPFLVLNGDDVYAKEDLEQCVKHQLALSVFPCQPTQLGSLDAVKINSDHHLIELYKPTETELQQGVLLVTGAYVLDKRIFNYQPALMPSGEYGLPHTIAVMAADYPVEVVKASFWLPVNSLEQLQIAEQALIAKIKSIGYNK